MRPQPLVLPGKENGEEGRTAGRAGRSTDFRHSRAIYKSGVTAGFAGKQREAELTVPTILAKAQRNRGYHHLTYNLARIYALGGKGEESVKWLRETVKEGFSSYPLFARDPFLDRIRKDAVFLQFLAEMKTRWEGYQREFG